MRTEASQPKVKIPRSSFFADPDSWGPIPYLPLDIRHKYCMSHMTKNHRLGGAVARRSTCPLHPASGFLGCTEGSAVRTTVADFNLQSGVRSSRNNINNKLECRHAKPSNGQNFPASALSLLVNECCAELRGTMEKDGRSLQDGS